LPLTGHQAAGTQKRLLDGRQPTAASARQRGWQTKLANDAGMAARVRGRLSFGATAIACGRR
jgi:hypothetical protein